ncbi:hypothetical protein FB446DRAFT_354015 [Lentinula raphanica]|nr:hypothetical protein FB446DRAFT_354015 [Lentinula raphanica]
MTIQDPPSSTDSPTSTSPISSSSTNTTSTRKRQRSTSATSETEEESLKRGSPRPQIDSLSITEAINMNVDSEMDSSIQKQERVEPSSVKKLMLIDELKQTPLALNQSWYLVDRAWWCRWRASQGEKDPKSSSDPTPESQLGPPSTNALIDEFGNLKYTLVEEIDFELIPEEAWNLLVKWYGEPSTPLRRNTRAQGHNKTTISVELHPPTFHVFRLTTEDKADDTLIPSQSQPSPPVNITLSANATVKDFHRECVSALHTGTASNLPQSRLWLLNDSSADHPSRNLPLSKFNAIGLFDVTAKASKTLEEALMSNDDSFALEFQDISSRQWLVEDEGTTGSELAEDEETTGLEPLFNSNDAFFNRMPGPSSSLTSTAKPNGDAREDAGKKMTVIAKKEPMKENWIEPGTLGLGNMGNTCFMNSAIQCLAHQKELAEYFLTGVYTREINADNPLGMGGAIAEGFGALLTRIWAGSELAQKYGALDKLREEAGGSSGSKNKVSKFFGTNPTFGNTFFGSGYSGGGSLSPSATSYSPREFKSQLSRFAPQFSGYQQHDSQELVAFLLDGLHEDLNRVLKKPYVEKPDWFGARPPVLHPFRERRTAKVDGEEEDKEEYQRAKEEYEAREREKYLQDHPWDQEVEEHKEMLRFARESWEGYKKRNDSVIVDLFQGQYRSTLVCPECQKVSITFDPFMYLTLPLPVQKKWRGVVYYVPWDVAKPHLKIPVEIGRDASFRDLRALLGRWMNALPQNLLTLEYFGHRFYKSLDDTVLCGEMGDNDTIICFELPCNSQQSRSWKRSEHPNDPWVLPLLLCDAPSTTYNTNSFARTYGNNRVGSNLFGYPTIVVVTPEQAKSVEGIYGAAIERLARWTKQDRDLWTWELPDRFTPISGTVPMENVETIPLDVMDEDSLEIVTEIGEDGAVVDVPQPVPARQQAIPPTPPEEGDIVDERSMVLDVEEDPLVSGLKSAVPVRLGPKKNIFTLRVGTGNKDYGTSGYNVTSVSWESRAEEAEKALQTNTDAASGSLLKDHDILYCDFDENMKSYYFGDDRSVQKFEHALWETWDEYLHPEYQESLKAASTKSLKGISLNDCLDEFTKEEQLGADDLWYCPRCRKHQQATKKFDLWSTPDVLVVHLKRFSNSRMLRDKIDTFVDFPISGLDLNERVDEKRVISKLQAMGVDTDSVGLLGPGPGPGPGNSHTSSESLIYDLFAVDEHLGGLGGGHYRAYAYNHMNNNWYHFDDAFVSKSTADSAVNANAYLLFYRRRSSSPLGGQSHDLIEQALRNQLQPEASTSASDNETNETPFEDSQLLTPPSEVDTLPPYSNTSPASSLGAGFTMVNLQSSQLSRRSTGIPIDNEESDFDTSLQIEHPVQLYDELENPSMLTFPEPSSSMGNSSPTSSIDVEPDVDDDSRSDDLVGVGEDIDDWGSWSREAQAQSIYSGTELRAPSPVWSGSAHSPSQRSSGIASPDNSDELNPFADSQTHV